MMQSCSKVPQSAQLFLIDMAPRMGFAFQTTVLRKANMRSLGLAMKSLHNQRRVDCSE